MPAKSSAARGGVIALRYGKWVGACPAGAQPGDLMPASGVMVHLRKMMGK